TDIVIPVRTPAIGTIEGGNPLVMDIPWFGTHEWELMYDVPAHARSVQHVGILKLWQVHQLEQHIRHNNANCDAAVRVVWDKDPPGATVSYRLGLDPDKAKDYFDHLPDLGNAAARLAIATQCLQDVDSFK